MALPYWMDKLLAAAEEFARDTSFQSEFSTEVVFNESSSGITHRSFLSKQPNMVGAYLPIVGDHESILVGLFSQREHVEHLARVFLSLEPEAPLSREYTADAAKEMVNIISGILKRDMPEYKPLYMGGLPMFVEGFVELMPGQAAACALVSLGGVNAYLSVVHSKNQPRAPRVQTRPAPAVPLDISDWLGAAVDATLLFAQKTLPIREYRILQQKDLPEATDIMGVYVPVISQDDAALLGLLANAEGMTELVRSFLQLGSEAELSNDDLVDALKEILNILSGILKQQMFGQKPIQRRGLPIFICGTIELAGDQEAAGAMVEMGKFKVYLTVIRQCRPALSPKV
jgi:hypothetical protein